MKQHGIILVITLLLLFALALLGLTAMNTSQLEIRMSGNLIDSLHEFQITEAILNKVEKSPILENCKYPPLSKARDKTPWLDLPHKCSEKFMNNTINYVIEEFPNEVCVLINEQRLPGKYYRLTVWPETKDREPLVLQSTYAVPNPSAVCQTDTKTIPPGRLSWRELN